MSWRFLSHLKHSKEKWWKNFIITYDNYSLCTTITGMQFPQDYGKERDFQKIIDNPKVAHYISIADNDWFGIDKDLRKKYHRTDSKVIKFINLTNKKLFLSGQQITWNNHYKSFLQEFIEPKKFFEIPIYPGDFEFNIYNSNKKYISAPEKLREYQRNK